MKFYRAFIALALVLSADLAGADTYNFVFAKPSKDHPSSNIETGKTQEAGDSTSQQSSRNPVPRLSLGLHLSYAPSVQLGWSPLPSAYGIGGDFGYRLAKHFGFSIWGSALRRNQFYRDVAVVGVDLEYYILSLGEFPWEYSPFEVALSVGGSSYSDEQRSELTPHAGIKLVHNIERYFAVSLGGHAGLGYYSTELGLLFRL